MFYSRAVVIFYVFTIVWAENVQPQMSYPLANQFPSQFNPYGLNQLNYGYNPYHPFYQPHPMHFYPGFPFKPNQEQQKISATPTSGYPQNFPFQNIPTEIIDVDDIVRSVLNIQDASGMETTTAKQGAEATNLTPKPSHVTYVGGIKYSESKPIRSSLHRTITSNGKSQSINIHMVNGVEVTEAPLTTTEEPAEEVSSEDPKPVNSWLFG